MPMIKGGDGSTVRKGRAASNAAHQGMQGLARKHAIHKVKGYLCTVCPRNTQAAAAMFSHGVLSRMLCKQTIASAVAAALYNSAGAAEGHGQGQSSNCATAQGIPFAPDYLSLHTSTRWRLPACLLITEQAAAGTSLLAC